MSEQFKIPCECNLPYQKYYKAGKYRRGMPSGFMCPKCNAYVPIEEIFEHNKKKQNVTSVKDQQDVQPTAESSTPVSSQGSQALPQMQRNGEDLQPEGT